MVTGGKNQCPPVRLAQLQNLDELAGIDKLWQNGQKKGFGGGGSSDEKAHQVSRQLLSSASASNKSSMQSDHHLTERLLAAGSGNGAFAAGNVLSLAAGFSAFDRDHFFANSRKNSSYNSIDLSEHSGAYCFILLQICGDYHTVIFSELSGCDEITGKQPIRLFAWDFINNRFGCLRLSCSSQT